MKRFFTKGESLIEVVLAMAIAMIVLPIVVGALITTREGKAQQVQRMQAVTLLKESEQAVRAAHNANWSNISTNGTFHPVISGNAWGLAANSETLNTYFTRQVEISDVVRDSTGAIVTSGGTVDPSTKKAVITISWNLPYASSLTSTMYFTRTGNLTHLQTTQSDFNSGSNSGTTVYATGNSPTDGQIELGGGTSGAGNWCEPNLSITAHDLPKNGVANAIAAIPGKVFAGTGDNSSGVSYARVNITDTDPPTASTLGTFNGYKTNDVFGDATYTYLATDNNSKEVVILNTSTTPYTEVGYFNAPGNGDASSVYVVGNVGYVAVDETFYTFNLNSKSGSRSQLGSRNLTGTVSSFVVQGNYAYLALEQADDEMQIINVSNPSSMSLLGTGEVNPQQINATEIGRDIVVSEDGTRAYLALEGTNPLPELIIFDISTKTGNRPIVGMYDTNGMNPTGLAIVSDHKVIMVGHGGEEYQVVNVAYEAAPSRCGGVQVNSGVNGVAAVTEADEDVYAYIITGDSSSELKIIEGGAEGQADWCSPADETVATLTLPKQGNALSGKAGEAFVATGDGSGINFTDIGITTPAPPTDPVPSIIANFSSNLTTNDVFSDGDYAYLAVNGSTTQVRILDIQTTPTEIGTISLPSNTNANGVYVVNNIAYVTSSNKLYTYDVTTKTGGHATPLGETDMYVGSGSTPTAKNIIVMNDKVYVAASNSIHGLQVFTVSDGGTLLTLVGVSNNTWSFTAQGLTVNGPGTRAYVAYSNGTGSTQRGFFSVDTSLADPPPWWPIPNFYSTLATYSSGSTVPTGITLTTDGTYKVLLTGTGGSYQYHVVNVANESSPAYCGGMAISSGVKDVVTVQDQYSTPFAYLLTSESSNQFKIIEGGNGRGSYITEGNFTSSIYSAGTTVSFNNFNATISQPAQTTLRMQVAVAAPVGGSCTNATYTYVGPDGSTTSYFTPSGNSISATIPFGSYSPSYVNPGQCVRYKTWFTTWYSNQTPVLNDVTINYSP